MVHHHCDDAPFSDKPKLSCFSLFLFSALLLLPQSQPHNKNISMANNKAIPRSDKKGGKRKKQHLKLVRSYVAVTTCYLMMIMAVSVHVVDEIGRIEDRKKKYVDIANRRKARKRHPWSQEIAMHSNRMFYRLFRMKPKTFKSLCQKVEKTVGPERFKSEQYLNELFVCEEGSATSTRGPSLKSCRMYRNSKAFSRDYISGEWKLALALQYLAGSTCLSLYLWSRINPDHIKVIVNDVLENWICNNDVIKIDFYDEVLYNNKNSNRIRREFANKTDGIIDGCIGAVDGWLVKIFSPTSKEVSNPGKYYSGKVCMG